MNSHHDTPSAEEVKNYLDRRFGQENALLHHIRTRLSENDQLPKYSFPICERTSLTLDFQKGSRMYTLNFILNFDL